MNILLQTLLLISVEGNYHWVVAQVMIMEFDVKHYNLWLCQVILNVKCHLLVIRHLTISYHEYVDEPALEMAVKILLTLFLILYSSFLQATGGLNDTHHRKKDELIQGR